MVLNKIKKKLSIIVMVVMSVLLMQTQGVDAANLSLGLSVKNNGNGTLTATVGGSIVGKVSVSVNGQSQSAYLENIGDKKSMTFSTGKGTFTVTATGDNISNANYETNDAPVVESKSVTVTKPAPKPSNPTNNNNTTTQTPVKDTRSSENKLSSLSVSAGTLSPTFSESQTSYKVELTSETQTIEVSAKAKDSKATVSGTGKHDLKIGENSIVVTVKAENGAKKTYTISIYVTEKPSIFVTLNDQNLGVLNDYSKIDTPKGFEKATEKIENQDVSVLKNENTGLTLIYLIDDSGQAGFYIFEDGKVLRKYETITILSKTYVILDVSKDIEKQDGLVRGKVTIGEVELDGWTFEDKNHENYSVVYLMNDAGEKNLYVYENTEGTLQKYVAYEQKNDNTLAYVFMGTTGLFAVSTIALFVMHRNFNKKSIASIKEYYESKNQG